ncbi:MAG: DUF302 domain-containing protein [Magnetococcales bacterium]|nr:DUF302 domain-containing protein [Magnetococcales bacterium]
MSKPPFSTTVTFSGDFDNAVEQAKAALMEQGFGVLTEINVSGVFKTKLDVDYPRTQVLGACNPKLAHRALSAEAAVATLVPCNVVVREAADGSVEVAALDFSILTRLMDNPEIAAVAKEGDEKLRAVLSKLANA